MFNFFEKKDSKIQEDIVKELKWDPSITSEQIEVSVKDGIVTLRGNVPHYYEKSCAEMASQRVSGVRAVTDEIEVNLMGSYERTDADIAEAALSSLKWNYSTPRGINVVVEKGWVTLSGEANWEYQRQAARNAVSHLMGVIGVSNDITLIHQKPVAKVDEIIKNIQEAFKRTATKDGEHINVKLEGNRVILSGTVQSRSELEDATFAAWCSPGVYKVENNLIISQQ